MRYFYDYHFNFVFHHNFQEHKSENKITTLASSYTYLIHIIYTKTQKKIKNHHLSIKKTLIGLKLITTIPLYCLRKGMRRSSL